MKKIALAAALSLAATSAFAGNLEAPIVEAPVAAPAPTGSAGGILIPIALIVLLAAAASSNGD